MANFHKYIELRILETKTCMGCNREENQKGITKTNIYSGKGQTFNGQPQNCSAQAYLRCL